MASQRRDSERPHVLCSVRRSQITRVETKSLVDLLAPSAPGACIMDALLTAADTVGGEKRCYSVVHEMQKKRKQKNSSAIKHIKINEAISVPWSHIIRTRTAHEK